MIRFILFISSVVFLLFLSDRAVSQNNQTISNGSLTNAIDFQGTGCTYKWINSNPSIGLAGSGTGNIAPITAINIGSSPVTATITATSQPNGSPDIADYRGSNVSVINTMTNTVISTIPVGNALMGYR
jgi:DNA-binding beta-propeller fold protein YncE